MTLLLTGIGRLFTATEAGVMQDAAVLVDGDRIAWVGRSGQRPPVQPDEVVDVAGALVTPGLIDAHTHPVYAGDRLDEIARRSAGTGYAEVAAAGGGIAATVTATRAAGRDELAAAVRGRLASWLAHGCTTVEAKTGYHLTGDGELDAVRLLAAVGSLDVDGPTWGTTVPRTEDAPLPRVEITFLAAHDVPPERRGEDGVHGAWAREAAAMCSDAAAAGARFVDVFCDEGYFTVAQSRTVLEAGKAAGLRPRIHADELARTGGAQLAAELGAVSADHLLRVTAEDAEALARAGVVATLCPVTALALGTPPPARLLADHGVTLALGSDHNPGQSGTTDMGLVVGLAVHALGLSVDEALRAATVGGARSLARPDRGQVAPGHPADLVVWDADHEAAFAWQLAVRPTTVLLGGTPVVPSAPAPPAPHTPSRSVYWMSPYEGRSSTQNELGDPDPDGDGTGEPDGGAPGERVVVVRGEGLTAEDVVAVAREDVRVVVADEAVERMARSRALVERLAEGDEPVYGISTGFGALASTRIPATQRRALQHAVVLSHAAGMGPPVEREVVRAMVLLRARSLAMGWSGVRPGVVQALVDLLAAGLTPVVPEHGSLGASGDLAPLAHVSACLLGEGEVTLPDGRTVTGAEGLAHAGLVPLALEAKEGIALVNGTDGMLGMLVLAAHDATRLLATAEVAAAMSVEALLGTDRAFAADLQALRPHPGQARSAEHLTRLLHGSEIVASHRHDDPRVQDAYSMRCAPQVLGAARDTLAFARQVAERELAAAVDNPVVLPDGRVESNGNFHGAPLGYACDFLAIALTDVASMAERRVDRLLDATRSAGLPPFLAPEPGVNSGLMIAQYTAAAMVAESQQLAYPASVDSVPTSGMQEDHVSMGWTAARKLRRVLASTARVVAVELVAAAAGLDLRAPLRPAPATGAVRDLLRSQVPGPGPDRVLAPDLAAAEQIVTSGAALGAASTAIGDLPWSM